MIKVKNKLKRRILLGIFIVGQNPFYFVLFIYVAQIMNEFLLQFVDFNNKGLTNLRKYAII